MSWLDKFFRGGYTTIAIAGAVLPSEVVLNFVSGASAADNPSLSRTDVTINAVGAPTGSGLIHVTGGSADPTAYHGAAGQWLLTASSGTDTAWATMAGDATSDATTVGQVYVGGLSGNATGFAHGAAPAIAVNGTGAALNWVDDVVKLNKAGTTLLQLGAAAGDFIKLGVNPAQSGNVRGSNGVNVVVARNAANTADIIVLGTNNANDIIVGGTNAAGFAVLLGGTVVLQQTQASTDLVRLGASPSQAVGFIAVSNNKPIVGARNAANTGDITVLSTDSSNNVITGGTNAASIQGLVGAQTVYNLNASGGDFVAFSGTPSLGGNIRTANTANAVTARNAANSADIVLIGSDASNNVIVGNGNANGFLVKVGAGTTPVQIFGTSSDFIQLGAGTGLSATGSLRFPNATTIMTARNAANSADVVLIATNSSNDLLLGGTNCAGSAILLGGTIVLQQTQASSDLARFGASPAQSGFLACANNATALAGRNAANSADIPLVATDSSNNVTVGDNTQTHNLNLRSNNQTILLANNIAGVTVTSSSVIIGNVLAMTSQTVAGTATAGGSGAPPATVANYLAVSINSTNYKIPLYSP